MGKQARLKRERREMRAEMEMGRRLRDTPIRVLRAIHKTIQDHCHESPRRCWEYLLEMLAHGSGWKTDSAESKHLWDKMANETRWVEFVESWLDEVEWAKRNRAPFSEPLGDLLEEILGVNDYHGQFFTPMSVVRLINELNLTQGYVPPEPNGMPGRRILDPCCGTGRFMIDALIHDDGVLVHGVDIDLWLLRCAMLNVRLLSPWTSLRLTGDPDILLEPLRRARKQLKEPVDGLVDGSAAVNPFSRPDPETRGENVIIIGGRSIFMNGDALIVDLDYKPNWVSGGWHWSPLPWRDNLKIAGYYGTYNQWVAAGRPPLGQEEKGREIQFDYSMSNKQAAAV